MLINGTSYLNNFFHLYIDAFCQVWFHLVQLFQRSRLKYEKLTDGRRTPSDGNTSHDPFGSGELKKYIYLFVLIFHIKKSRIPFRQQIWPPRTILVSDWLMLKKFSPLKLLGQMEPNLAGSIYVRSSIKLLHLVPFGQQTELLLAAIFVGQTE
jgi:hypothetical protein